MTDCDKGCIILSYKSPLPKQRLTSHCLQRVGAFRPQVPHVSITLVLTIYPCVRLWFLPTPVKGQSVRCGHRTRGPFTFMVTLRSSSNPASTSLVLHVGPLPQRMYKQGPQVLWGRQGPHPTLQPSYWLLLCSQFPLRLYSNCHSHHTPPQLTRPSSLAAHHANEITYLKATRAFHGQIQGPYPVSIFLSSLETTPPAQKFSYLSFR